VAVGPSSGRDLKPSPPSGYLVWLALRRFICVARTLEEQPKSEISLSRNRLLTSQKVSGTLLTPKGSPRDGGPSWWGAASSARWGGWAEVRAQRQRGEATRADPCILGSGEFVAHILADSAAPHTPLLMRARVVLEKAQALLVPRCADAQMGLPELQGGSRRAPVVALRGKLARHFVAHLGLSLADTAQLLGVSTSGIAKSLARGEVKSD